MYDAIKKAHDRAYRAQGLPSGDLDISAKDCCEKMAEHSFFSKSSPIFASAKTECQKGCTDEIPLDFQFNKI